MESLHKCDPELNFLREIPTEPVNPAVLLERADQLATHYDVKGGRVSGTCYSPMDQENIELLSEVNYCICLVA